MLRKMKNKLLIIVSIFGLCIMGGCKEKENKTTSENEETDIGYNGSAGGCSA